jgi:hypothetical protein
MTPGENMGQDQINVSRNEVAAKPIPPVTESKQTQTIGGMLSAAEELLLKKVMNAFGNPR